MKENNNFKVSKSEYKIIKRYITAFEQSQARTLYDVYKKPSFMKKTAYAEHEYIVDTLYTYEMGLPFEKCYETRITSFNQFMFTCVTKLEFNSKPYSIYVISLPSTTYIYFTTQEVVKIFGSNDIEPGICVASRICNSYPENK